MPVIRIFLMRIDALLLLALVVTMVQSQLHLSEDGNPISDSCSDTDPCTNLVQLMNVFNSQATGLPLVIRWASGNYDSPDNVNIDLPANTPTTIESWNSTHAFIMVGDMNQPKAWMFNARNNLTIQDITLYCYSYGVQVTSNTSQISLTNVSISAPQVLRGGAWVDQLNLAGCSLTGTIENWSGRDVECVNSSLVYEVSWAVSTATINSSWFHNGLSLTINDLVNILNSNFRIS